jgi:TolB-like protein/Tfp pilus assembly protein PilF
LSEARQTPAIVRFGNFAVDLRSGELRKAGIKIKLQEQPFKILSALLERPGEMVSREELRQRIWPQESFGDFDHAVNIAVAKLRAALNDSAEKPQFIETLHRRGYRFVCHVNALGAEAAARRDGVAGPSIAVLPFANLSADPANEYFCDGLAEELINTLSKVEQVRVVARTSAFSFKGKQADVREIGQKLNVSAVLEGSVRKSGNRLRIAAQLIDAANGYHLWSARYDREMEMNDIFEVQDEITLAVVDALKVKLLGEERLAVLKHHTENTEAYLLYLKGLYHRWKTAPEEFKRSRNYFQRAVDSDPGFALGYFGLNSFYGYGSAWGMLSPNENWPKAKAALEKALDLDPLLPEAHLSLSAYALVCERDLSGAEREIKRVIRWSPNLAEIHHLYSFYLITAGRFDEAIEESKRALECDPLSITYSRFEGLCFYFARRYDDAIARYQEALELDSNNMLVHESLGDAYEMKGSHHEAIASWQQALTLAGNYELAGIIERTFCESGFAAALRGVAQKRLEQMDKKAQGAEYVPAIDRARAYLRLGDRDQTFHWLEKACDERNVFPLLMSSDPFYDGLRGEARFEQLRGYRFVAPISPSPRPSPRHPKPIESIAVLPFSNCGIGVDTEYLSDGITEAVINSLSQGLNLLVIARSTAFQYKHKETDPQQVGNDLRVHAVVVGKLLQRGDTVMVQAELVDVATGAQLWGGQFKRKAEDIFALQDDLSKEISEKLRARLDGDEVRRLTKRQTENADAYRLYLKGRYHWNKRNPEAMRKAIEYFHKALESDPGYALAYAGLADTYNHMSFLNVVPPREAMPKAKNAAQKALEMDGQLAEAHVSLGYASFTYDGDWPAAGNHFERALGMNPSYSRTHTFYAFYLSSLGRHEQALDVARFALDHDPASPAVSHSLAVQLYLAGRFDQAIEQARQTLELDTNFAIAYAPMGEAYLSKGMYQEALPLLEKYAALSQSSAASLGLLGYSHARSGQRTEALRIIEQLTEASKHSFVPAFFLALVYTGLEENDRAFAWLETAHEERFNRLAYLKLEALWDPLRSDSRFTDLVRRIGIPQ